MNDIFIDGNPNPILLKEYIYGFAGTLITQNKFGRNTYSLLIQNKHWKAFLYYSPAEYGHHLPQDALGIRFINDSIKFSIADGVSIVNGTSINLSGEIALELMKASLTNDDQEKYRSLSATHVFKTLGATTLQSGHLSEQKLQAEFLGSIDNLGSAYYLDNNNLLESFLIGGTSFFPREFYTEKNDIQKNLNGIVTYSDGVTLIKNELLSLFTLIKNAEKKEIEEKLISVLNNSSDDQSLIIILRK